MHICTHSYVYRWACTKAHLYTLMHVGMYALVHRFSSRYELTEVRFKVGFPNGFQSGVETMFGSEHTVEGKQ